VPFVNDKQPLKLSLTLGQKIKKYPPDLTVGIFYEIILSFKL